MAHISAMHDEIRRSKNQKMLIITKSTPTFPRTFRGFSNQELNRIESARPSDGESSILRTLRKYHKLEAPEDKTLRKILGSHKSEINMHLGHY